MATIMTERRQRVYGKEEEIEIHNELSQPIFQDWTVGPEASAGPESTVGPEAM
jgi:hypothetical protein